MDNNAHPMLDKVIACLRASGRGMTASDIGAKAELYDTQTLYVFLGNQAKLAGGPITRDKEMGVGKFVYSLREWLGKPPNGSEPLLTIGRPLPKRSHPVNPPTEPEDKMAASYIVVLTDLKQKRDQINAAIAALEALAP